MVTSRNAPAGPTGLLEGRRVLVVGASNGIGRSFATAAAGLGADVALASRDRDAIGDAAAGIGVPIVGDVTEPEDCRRVTSMAAEALGDLDAVLYTPAPGYQKLLDATTQADWDEQFHAIVVGASNITRSVLPFLAEGALVAYLSSVITRAPQFGMSSYASCKAALETMIQGWQLEQPAYRFSAIVIGATSQVRPRPQHHRDPALRREIMRQFTGRGFMQTRPMEAGDLGQFLSKIVATLLAHPDINLPEIVVRSSAPTLFLDDVGFSDDTGPPGSTDRPRPRI
jgi:NAD(P)-dependent dehydrogenase (short-subunit alcohol dehydrogenase family)